jgi:hypothetical protein
MALRIKLSTCVFLVRFTLSQSCSEHRSCALLSACTCRVPKSEQDGADDNDDINKP